MRKINGILDATSTKANWVQLNPYAVLGTEPKSFTAKDLLLDEVLVDNKGTLVKIVEFGGSGLFGKDSYSWMWVKMRIVRHQKNPGRYYFSINTHNPAMVSHKSLENPEGSKYGGVGFGGWAESVEEVIYKFPKKYREESTHEMYRNKFLNIISIRRTDVEIGDIDNIEATEDQNKLLQSL